MEVLLEKVKHEPLERHEYNELVDEIGTPATLKPQQRMRKGEHYLEKYLETNDAFYLSKSIKYFNRTIKCAFVAKHFDALFPFDDAIANQPHHKGVLLLEYGKFLRYISKFDGVAPRYTKALKAFEMSLKYFKGGYEQQAMGQITLCLIDLERYEAAKDWAKKTNTLGASLNSIKSQIGIKMQSLSKYKRKRIRAAFSEIQLPTDEMLLDKTERLIRAVECLQDDSGTNIEEMYPDRIDERIQKMALRFNLDSLELSDSYDDCIALELSINEKAKQATRKPHQKATA